MNIRKSLKALVLTFGFTIFLSGILNAESLPVSYYYGGGWVTLDYSATHSKSVYLSGEAFISPTWWHCCSGSAEDTGVTVTWRNETTGVAGKACQTVKYGMLFPLYDHRWSASVPLVAGNNVVTITASDPDGKWGKAVINVIPTINPPVANDQSVTAYKNTAKAITLNAVDVDGDTLTYSIVSGPSHGTLSGTLPNVTYTPTTNYIGSDSFTFKANDGMLDSNIATVSITVTTDTTPPTVTITSPTSNSTISISTSYSSLNIGGTASDNVGVTQVTWRNNRGGSGACSGTTSWSASLIPLFSGQNIITVTAQDAAGNSGTDTLTVTYKSTIPTGLRIIGYIARGIRLAWDPNTESDLAGYKIYYGTYPITYTTSIDVENVTNYTLTGLTPGQTYYIAVTAYHITTIQSGYSDEVSGVAPSTPTGDLRALYVPAGDSMNPYINEFLTIHRFEIEQQAQIPADLTNYDLIIVSKNEACNPTSANSIRNFVLNGGGAIIMGSTPLYLAAGSSNDLSSIREWFGAGTYGNDCGYATVSIPSPFGTDLLVGDELGYMPADTCFAASVYNQNAETTIISNWTSGNGIFAFTYLFGRGRVFYFAGDPGYSEKSLTLFEAGLLRCVYRPHVDFDGDTKTDVAVYDVANGWWYLHNSKDGSYGFDAIGVGGGSQWKPVPGDYDGDGKTDVAVYDTQYGWWLFHYSSGGYFYDHIGQGGTGYGAVPGDYDGDGVTDIAVYNVTNGYWYIKYSNGGGYGFDSLGGSGKIPVNVPYLLGLVF